MIALSSFSGDVEQDCDLLGSYNGDGFAFYPGRTGQSAY
jgi:hypothetical protein